MFAAQAVVVSAASAATGFMNGHAYRRGAVGFRGHQQAGVFSPAGLRSTAGLSVSATGPNDMSFGGAISGVGVTTGHEQVYLIFWGSQWGTQSTDSSGYASFSGDSKGMAPDLQAFFKGLGTNGETWSGVATQYCQGIATGAFSCPASNTQHVGYPTGGALAGVWEDSSSLAPSTATGHQIGQEAENAAAHFGLTTTAANRNVQYVIVSPHGTNPDGYKTGGFCAWHDFTGDTTLDGGGAISGSLIAFTNLPYLTDAGLSCGEDYVNGAGGTLDGVTMVEGHEYAETITDQYPAGGWTTPSGADAGEEIGDLCAWDANGPDSASNLMLATGSFAVQTMWSNDYNGGAGGCLMSHPIVTNPSTNTVTVTNPGNQPSGTVGTAVSLQIGATDSDNTQTLIYTASGLPAGLSINSASGLISGTPSAAGSNSVTVKATDTTGASGSATFSWPIANAAQNTITVSNPGNQTGTVGTAVSLQISASDSASGQTLTYSASGLPAGLSINSSTGSITGTPTAPGGNTVTVTAQDTTGASGSASFSWTIGNVAQNTVSVTNPGAQNGTYGTATSLQIMVTDSASGQTLTYSASGLPAGLSIGSSTGLISGTPTAAGTDNVTVTATDTTGAHGSASLTWTIAKAQTTVTASPTTGTTRSATFKATLTLTGTGAPISGMKISFTVNSRTYCSATTNASGVATCSTSSRFTASSYTAAFAGTTNLLASSGRGIVTGGRGARKRPRHRSRR